MAIANTAHGGSATNTTVSATTLAITVTAAAGEFIYVTISTLAAVQTTNVTDNAATPNKYYLLNDRVGASGRISCWFCPKSSGSVTTVTATHGAGRASGSVSTYTGVLGVGHCQETTNAANNNTITMSPAIGSGNVMIAGMGDAVGTQTWTAVTGTLRNNIAGGGSTTPGATNMDTLVSGGSTLAASLSSSVSGEAIAIEVFGSVLSIQSNLDIESSQAPFFMWSMGTMDFLAEEDTVNWGFQPTGAGTGAQLMGFRGFRVLKAGMPDVDADQYLFKPPFVPAISSFDQDEGFFNAQAFNEQDDNDIWGWMPPMIQTYQEDALYQDQPQQSAYYFDALSLEEFNWGFNLLGQGSGGTQMGDFKGFWSLRAGMGSEYDIIGQPSIVVVTVVNPFDFDYPPAQQAGYYNPELDTESDWVMVLQGSSNTTMSGFRGNVIYPSAMMELPDFGFNQPVGVVKTGFDEDEGIFLIDLQQQWTDDDKTDSTFFALEEYSDNDEQSLRTGWLRYQEEDQTLRGSPFITQYPDDNSLVQYVTGWKMLDQIEEWLYEPAMAQNPYDEDSYDLIYGMVGYYFNEADDEPFGFNFVPATNKPLPEDAEFNLAQQQSYYFGQEDLEKYNWGWKPPTLATGREELLYDQILQQLSYYWQDLDVEEFEWGLNPPAYGVGTQMGAFKGWMLKGGMLADDFGFEPVLVQADNALDQIGQTWWSRDQVEDNQFGEQVQFYADFEEEPDVNQWFQFQDDEPWAFNFVAPTNRPLPEDAEFNLAQQQSYYFQQEDLEKYNWGWMPPMTKVIEDDAPYDAQPQLRSYFNPMLEDETLNFGLWRYWSFDEDELPDMLLQQEFHEEDFGLAPVFIQADDAVPSQANYAKADDEAFGFRPQVFIATDDSPEQVPGFQYAKDDVDYFGFNAPVVTVTTPFGEDDQIPVQTRAYAEDETFGLQPAMAQDLGETLPQVNQRAFTVEDEQFGEIIVIAEVQAENPQASNYSFGFGLDEAILSTPFVGADQAPEFIGQRVDIQDEERQVAINITQPFSFGDEIDHLPNPPYPITHQTDFDQHGQNPPFIVSQPFAWEEAGVPSNQPWPVLDVTDYNDFIKNIITEILKIYNVSIKNVLAIMSLSAVQQELLYQVVSQYQFTIANALSESLFSISEVNAVPLLSVTSVQVQS